MLRAHLTTEIAFESLQPMTAVIGFAPFTGGAKFSPRCRQKKAAWLLEGSDGPTKPSPRGRGLSGFLVRVTHLS